MASPLVTIICLCHNHEKYLVETLASVLNQTYRPLELIVVDDASQDGSVAKIKAFLATHPTDIDTQTLFLEENLGNCAAFNRGWGMARGEFVIDLATDDIMLPERVARQVNLFESLSNEHGVVFSESQYIDEAGKPLHFHYGDQYRHISPIPVGYVYQDVLARYFISSPTMMIRNEVLKKLNGYDETLAYEDFDFWVRSAREYQYAYLDRCTTLVRRSGKSMSRGWYKSGDRQLLSTYRVCEKAGSLIRNQGDREALAQRVKFELRQAVLSGLYEEADLFFNLLEKLDKISLGYRLIRYISILKLDLRVVKYIYHRVKS